MPDHKHPGEGEPRSYGQTHHEEREIDLNSATLDEIAALPMVGRQRAQAIVDHRPFNSWEEVRRVPGLDAGMVDDLKSGGARIGSPEKVGR
jgi:DNA uptake protein ComE-like DNA-binding protein